MSYPPQQPDPYQQPQHQMPVVPSAPPSSPGPYGQPYPPQIVVAAGPPTSGWATASLVFGIIGVLGGWCMFAIPCVIAVICGHAGMRDTNGGVKSGRGMAQAGLILGYLVVGPALLIAVMGIGGGLLPGGSN